MRALLLKPAALGAAFGLAFFGIALLLLTAIVAHASVADSSTDCSSPPATSTIIASSNTGVTGGGASPTTLSTSAVEVSSNSLSSADDTPGPTDTATPTPTSTDTATPDATSGDGSSSSSADTAPPSSDPGGSSDTSGSDPSSTPSTSASPTPELCVLAEPYPSSADVLAGDPATYIVQAWSLTADSSNVSVTASVTAASYLGSPGFAICPSTSGATCTIASLPVGQVYELVASVPTTSAAPTGTDIQITVTATATGALSDSSSATDVVAAPTATSSSSTSGGSSSSAVPPLISLPPIPGTGVTATNPSDLFPAVSPSPSSGSLGLPPAKARHVTRAATTAYAVPVDPRLLGAQVIGLVALAGAVTIAIVRLSLRKPQLSTSGSGEPTDPPAAP